jgi:hypothetical protein
MRIPSLDTCPRNCFAAFLTDSSDARSMCDIDRRFIGNHLTKLRESSRCFLHIARGQPDSLWPVISQFNDALLTKTAVAACHKITLPFSGGIAVSKSKSVPGVLKIDERTIFRCGT